MITTEEYRARRQNLINQLPKDSIAIIFANTEVIRNGDAHYRFRQDSNFYYLTGFNEPQAILIIDPEQQQSIIFNQAHDPQTEIWHGKVLGQETAKAELGVDAAYPITDIELHLKNLLSTKAKVFYDLQQFANYEQYLLPVMQLLKNSTQRNSSACTSLHDLKPLISEMRLIKSPTEIELMQKAVEISVAAHKRTWKKLANSANEAIIEAELLYEMQRLGCRNVAYDSIVASGNNACTLHYTKNNQEIIKNGLILIDAGGEFANYAADITRTIPANGKFNQQQAQIYNLVLKAQKAAIALVKPHTIWNKIQETIIKIITTGLVELGILQGNVQNLIANKAYQEFYMHGSGHWLGLDVHDCGSYKINNQWRPLAEGMVLTVEPGIYIREGTNNVAKHWQGIGVRIEDDILVTKDGHKNLSADLPVTINEIEAYMRD